MTKKNTERATENQPEPAMAVINVTSFDDVEDVTYAIVVERPNLPALRFEGRELGYYEWVTTGKEIGYPQPPPFGSDSNGNMRFNVTDPTYVQARAEVDAQRNLRRLLKFLKLPVPGETPEDKIAALEKKFGRSVVAALVTQMQEIAFGGQARIEDRADTFHRPGTGGDAGNSPSGERPSMVVSANGG